MIFRIFFLWLVFAFPLNAKDLAYNVTFNGLSFGEMEVTLGTSGRAYEITAKARAKGFLGMILQSRYVGHAKGNKNGEILVPDSFRVQSDRVFKHRLTIITFRDGKPEKVELTPLKDHTTFTDPSRVSDTRIDSLSGLFALFTAQAGKCVGPLALYDGRRLLSVAFGPALTEDSSVVCKGHYRIDEGPDHSIQKGQRSFDLIFIYPTNGGAPETVEVVSGGNVVKLTKQ